MLFGATDTLRETSGLISNLFFFSVHQLTQETDYIFGLFDTSHMPYHIMSEPGDKPTLEEMVGKALDVLEKDRKGYFLFVEGE